MKRPTGKQLLILLIGLLSLLVIIYKGQTTLFLPLLICTLVSAGLGSLVIPKLKELKMGQVIREDGPREHLKKSGTPTMGGIFFVPVAVAIALPLAKFDPRVIAVSLLTLAYMGIGFLDDWQILKKRSNKGISPKQKLALQIGGAVLFCLWSMTTGKIDTDVDLPGSLLLSLEVLFWGLAGFVLVAESNATNLTDGVDGLAGGTGAIAFLGMGIIIYPNNPALALFCACFSGACLGFIFHNHNPAKVFMGDTGSLALGGALGAVGIISGELWALLLISGIFLLESLSVIAQVSYYKATKDENGVGKRLFKMAPFHHHLELSGWAETRIVGTFYIVNTLLVILGIYTSS